MKTLYATQYSKMFLTGNLKGIQYASETKYPTLARALEVAEQMSKERVFTTAENTLAEYKHIQVVEIKPACGVVKSFG